MCGHTRPGHTPDLDLDSRNPDEALANAFAAELLMPTHFVLDDYKKGLKETKKLATKYLVSEEAMGWKLYGLLSKL